MGRVWIHWRSWVLASAIGWTGCNSAASLRVSDALTGLPTPIGSEQEPVVATPVALAPVENPAEPAEEPAPTPTDESTTEPVVLDLTPVEFVHASDLTSDAEAEPAFIPSHAFPPDRGPVSNRLRR